MTKMGPQAEFGEISNSAESAEMGKIAAGAHRDANSTGQARDGVMGWTTGPDLPICRNSMRDENDDELLGAT